MFACFSFLGFPHTFGFSTAPRVNLASPLPPSRAEIWQHGPQAVVPVGHHLAKLQEGLQHLLPGAGCLLCSLGLLDVGGSR